MPSCLKLEQRVLHAMKQQEEIKKLSFILLGFLRLNTTEKHMPDLGQALSPRCYSSLSRFSPSIAGAKHGKEGTLIPLV